MSVSLDELIEAVLIESGQFLGELEATLIDPRQFESMARRELKKYQKFRPLVKTASGDLFNAKSFSDDYGPEDIPLAITEIKHTHSSFHALFYGGQRYGVVSNYYWRYEKPLLFFNYPRDIYQYSYIANRKYDAEKRIFEDLDIDSDFAFVDIITGRFMMILGRSRRAFSLNDVPIVNDGSDLVSEGKEILESAYESIKESSYWYHAIIP